MTIESLWRYISSSLSKLGYSVIPEDMEFSDELLSEVLSLISSKYKIYVTDFETDLGKYSYIIRNASSGETLSKHERRLFSDEHMALLSGVAEALAIIKLNYDAGIIVAIDGYPACGKSTVAKRLAKEAGYTYIDSGAMYRAAALYYQRSKEEINEDTVKNIHIQFRKENGEQVTLLNGENVEKEIRTLEIGNLASKIGVNDVVREYLGAQQRKMGRLGGIVMDGRDIGTVVFPSAQLKLFMKADFRERTLRRFKDLNHTVTYDDVAKDLRNRDYRDVDQFNGKRKADDAIVIDNTGMTEDEQFDVVWSLFKQALVNYRLESSK